MPRTFSDEEMQKINDSIDVLLQATWDGDWNFDHGQSKKAVEFLRSVGLAQWFGRTQEVLPAAPESTPDDRDTAGSR
jgi:hypothetical protein